ncbi:hypothetical protein NADFUDRAFT_41835 [Nadsonia fulvescens var. elongata DSM 6958]|uniref:Uncharacterized protein n=1 Tax=Nadsonia fulvescens var. elongata DSM 6958 TaxID=857566 RepID=A0A1E3PK86_9ASCO|nr:hypothetical protein NADFUDRAFT_41835 [Nadsonia fulvescens var. elongata DSM 6958]
MLSVSEAYDLSIKARLKLSQEALKPDLNLRHLVCHANLLDKLLMAITAKAKKQTDESKPVITSSDVESYEESAIIFDDELNYFGDISNISKSAPGLHYNTPDDEFSKDPIETSRSIEISHSIDCTHQEFLHSENDNGEWDKIEDITYISDDEQLALFASPDASISFPPKIDENGQNEINDIDQEYTKCNKAAQDNSNYTFSLHTLCAQFNKQSFTSDTESLFESHQDTKSLDELTPRTLQRSSKDSDNDDNTDSRKKLHSNNRCTTSPLARIEGNLALQSQQFDTEDAEIEYENNEIDNDDFNGDINENSDENTNDDDNTDNDSSYLLPGLQLTFSGDEDLEDPDIQGLVTPPTPWSIPQAPFLSRNITNSTKHEQILGISQKYEGSITNSYLGNDYFYPGPPIDNTGLLKPTSKVVDNINNDSPPD